MTPSLLESGFNFKAKMPITKAGLSQAVTWDSHGRPRILLANCNLLHSVGFAFIELLDSITIYQNSMNAFFIKIQWYFP